MRPIDADALLEQYDELYSEYVPDNMGQMIDSLYFAIINAPALPEEAEWQEGTGINKDLYVCSDCHRTSLWKKRFCADCGKRMTNASV